MRIGQAVSEDYGNEHCDMTILYTRSHFIGYNSSILNKHSKFSNIVQPHEIIPISSKSMWLLKSATNQKTHRHTHVYKN